MLSSYTVFTHTHAHMHAHTHKQKEKMFLSTAFCYFLAWKLDIQSRRELGIETNESMSTAPWKILFSSIKMNTP
jgi:hypothetical protein